MRRNNTAFGKSGSIRFKSLSVKTPITTCSFSKGSRSNCCSIIQSFFVVGRIGWYFWMFSQQFAIVPTNPYFATTFPKPFRRCLPETSPAIPFKTLIAEGPCVGSFADSGLSNRRGKEQVLLISKGYRRIVFLGYFLKTGLVSHCVFANNHGIPGLMILPFHKLFLLRYRLKLGVIPPNVRNYAETSGSRCWCCPNGLPYQLPPQRYLFCFFGKIKASPTVIFKKKDNWWVSKSAMLVNKICNLPLTNHLSIDFDPLWKVLQMRSVQTALYPCFPQYGSQYVRGRNCHWSATWMLLNAFSGMMWAFWKQPGIVQIGFVNPLPTCAGTCKQLNKNQSSLIVHHELT